VTPWEVTVANPTSQVVQHLRRTLLQDGAGPTDGQLLGRFVERRDESAFAALVRRHGPMVWGVCHRLLSHHDAEDAFQATFIVLVRKAASVVPREMVANWLYGVANQTALHARRTAARRGARERQVTEMPEPAGAELDSWGDLSPLLDQELSRLPDKYRSVVVLCDLEGKARKEVAGQLGCPEGTVAGRLARARAMLARRLARRGVALSVGALAAAHARNAASAGVPAAAVSSTIKAAALLAAGQAATGATSLQVAALTEGVLKSMVVTRLKFAAVALLTAALVGLGTTAVAYRALASDRGTADAAAGIAKDRENRAGEAERLRSGESAARPGTPPGDPDPVARKPQAGGETKPGQEGAADGRAGDNSRLRGLLKERLEAVQKLADRVNELHKQGAATQDEVRQADLRVYKAELDLCDTTKERVAVLEKIAKVYEEIEGHTAALAKQGAASSEAVTEAKLSRLEAQIAVERERAKLATPKQ
jgi:RNA polymerase sigma factor (sigma-70 family)